LEVKIESLESEKQALNNEVQKLRQENKSLREQLQRTTPPTNNSNNSAPPAQSSIASLTKGKTLGVSLTRNSTNVKTASTALLIVIFTFAIFFTASNPQNPFKTSRELIPEVAPRAYAGSALFGQIREARGRKLLETEDSTSKSNTNIPVQENPSNNSSQTFPASPIQTIHSDQLQDTHLSNWMERRNQKFPNMAYFTCSNLQQIIPSDIEENTPYNPSSSFVFSLFIPNSLEITCQVLEVKNITSVQPKPKLTVVN